MPGVQNLWVTFTLLLTAQEATFQAAINKVSSEQLSVCDRPRRRRVLHAGAKVGDGAAGEGGADGGEGKEEAGEGAAEKNLKKSKTEKKEKTKEKR